MTLHRMIISTFGHVISLSLHKFVYKLIFFQQTVAAAASRHFIKKSAPRPAQYPDTK